MEEKILKYGQIGMIHNLTLNKVQELPSFPDYTTEEVHYLGLKTSLENFPLSKCRCEIFDLLDYDVFKEYYDLIKSHAEFPDVMDTLNKKGLLSSDATYLLNVFNSKMSVSKNVAEFMTAVYELEKSASQSDRLTEPEVFACCACASVAEYSLSFWLKAASDPQSVWFKYFEYNEDEYECDKVQTKAAKKEGKRKWWQTLIVVAADCVGVVVGAVVGSSIGSELTENATTVNAITGAGATTVATAFSASAEKLFDKK